jgi:hypothetical protein
MSETLTKRRRYDNGNRFRRESQNIKEKKKPVFIFLINILVLKDFLFY